MHDTAESACDGNGDAADIARVFEPPGAVEPVSEPLVGLIPGTRVETSSGERDVALLADDALILTPLSLDPDRADDPTRIWPIRIAAEAIGPGRPRRDLRVAPGTLLGLDVLGDLHVAAAALVNGATIVQEEPRHIDYVEVRGDAGAVLVAEGLPILAGTPRPETPRIVRDGPILEAIRLRLADRLASLGWTRDETPFAGLHLVVDGRIVEAKIRDLSACFLFPVEARTVWLVSAAATPRAILGVPDDRLLGISIGALSIDDGLTPRRDIALDDPRLAVGVHVPEADRIWTTGRALLPASLWDGCLGHVFLRVDLAGYALPRWVPPGGGAGAR